MDISVIIPTRNRLDVLKLNLGALASQDLAGYEAEVIVVDNGSTDDTVDWVLALAAEFPYQLRVVVEARRGVSAARNRGVALSTARYILSINDDTVPADRALVLGHIEAHGKSTEAAAVLGRIGYPQATVDRDPFMAWMDHGPQFDFDRLDSGLQPTANHCYTAHLSLPREQFLTAGGMEEDLEFGFEDAEFGHRLTKAGTQLRYRGDLKLVHHHPLSPRDWRRRNELMGAAGAHVNQIHPVEPPLAAVPDRLLSRLATAADSLLQLIPTDWRRAPRKVRNRVYYTIFLGAYFRGYRRQARSLH